MAHYRFAEWIHDTNLASQLKEYTKHGLTRNEIIDCLRGGMIYKNYKKGGSR